MSRFDGVKDRLSNNQLLIELKELVKRECGLEAELISHLGEVEARRLYLEQGCSSMFDYCLRVLCFSEGVAYKRIGVARAARKFPDVGLAISRGEIHLSAASLIAPHLSEESVGDWLKAARRKTTREIKQFIADRFPRDEVRSSIRRVSSRSRNADCVSRTKTTTSVAPASSTSSGSTASSDSSSSAAVSASPVSSASLVPTQSHEPGTTEALGARRYCVRFTADERVHAQLQELRSLLRHSVPDGDVGKVLARAIAVLLEQVRKQKIGACDSPRPKRKSKKPTSGTPRSSARSSEARPSEMRSSKERSSEDSNVRNPEAEPCSLQASSPAKKTPAGRNISVSIRRAVWARDAGRCTYQSSSGRSCGSREAIEFHHRVPWARCKEHTVDNIALRCRAHNQYEAVLDFGEAHMARFWRGISEETAGLLFSESDRSRRDRSLR